MIKLLLTNLFVMFCNKQLQVFTFFYHIFSIGVRMSWKIGENRNLFFKLNSKLGLYHVLLTTPKTSPEKVILTLIEMQLLPEIERVDSKNEISCLNWTKYNGRRKVCICFKTDMDKLNIVVYRYRNNTYVKDTEMELKLNEYAKLLSKQKYLLSYIDVFFKRCSVLDETTVHN